MLARGPKVQTALMNKRRQNGLGHDAIGFGIRMTVAGDAPAGIERHQHIRQPCFIENMTTQPPLGLRFWAEARHQNKRDGTPRAGIANSGCQHGTRGRDALLDSALAVVEDNSLGMDRDALAEYVDALPQHLAEMKLALVSGPGQ